jgi:hypothetical protein
MGSAGGAVSPGVLGRHLLAGSGRHGARRHGGSKPGPDQGAAATRQAGAGEPATARPAQWAYLAVLVAVAIALLIIGEGVHLVRSGTLVLAGVLLVAAIARLVLPDRLAGMLSSRRRLLDVAIFGVLGVGLLVAGLVVPVPG